MVVGWREVSDESLSQGSFYSYRDRFTISSLGVGNRLCNDGEVKEARNSRGAVYA